MKELSCSIDTVTGKFVDKSVQIYNYENDEYMLRIIGSVYIDDRKNDGNKILEIIKDGGIDITSKINGNYILVVFDKKKKRVTALHDRSTSAFILYYTVHNNVVYLDTSLKSLLKESKIERHLNDDAIEEFIVNGFVYGEETLITGVKKIKAFHALIVDKTGVNQVRVDYRIDDMTKGEALDAWKRVLDNAIIKSTEDVKIVALPLSSGYDSNYIANTLCNKTNKEIHAFSIGGEFGRNELPVVLENAKYYERLTLNTALTSKQTLKSFADIVWRLEGSVYESGLFLQYELAKLVSSKNESVLLCGECADQVMSVYYLQEDRIFPDSKNTITYYEFSEYPFIFGEYLILKKNGILANSFGIETRYPYLDEKFVSVAYALRNINMKDKRCHVANCKELLPPEIIKNMSKIGGATECHSLFKSNKEINSFLTSIYRSNVYKKYESLFKKHSFLEKNKQIGLPKIKTEIRNIVLNILNIGVDGRKKNEYFREEMQLNEAMKCAYLILFDRLFVSNAFDELMTGAADVTEYGLQF